MHPLTLALSTTKQDSTSLEECNFMTGRIYLFIYLEGFCCLDIAHYFGEGCISCRVKMRLSIIIVKLVLPMMCLCATLRHTSKFHLSNSPQHGAPSSAHSFALLCCDHSFKKSFLKKGNTQLLSHSR